MVQRRAFKSTKGRLPNRDIIIIREQGEIGMEKNSKSGREINQNQIQSPSCLLRSHSQILLPISVWIQLIRVNLLTAAQRASYP